MNDIQKTLAIIVTYKGFKWYNKCFNSLLNSVVPLDVIVVDNNSNDGTIEYIKEHFPTIHIIQNNDNAGFAKANNQAMEFAYNNGYDFFFLLNQDVYIEPNTLKILLKYAQNTEYSQFGIFSPVQISGDKKSFDFNLKKHYLQTINLNQVCEDLYFNRKKLIYEIPFINAAAWLITRKCYEKIGSFDTILFKHYGEDNNYCQRVIYHGLKIGFVFCSVCHDRENTSRNEMEQKKQDYLDAAILYGDINLSVVKILYKLLRNLAGSIVKLSPKKFVSFIRKIVFIFYNFRKVRESRKINMRQLCKIINL